ncbi:hypothetical protein [Yersinia phage vB_YenM_P778]
MSKHIAVSALKVGDKIDASCGTANVYEVVKITHYLEGTYVRIDTLLHIGNDYFFEVPMHLHPSDLVLLLNGKDDAK